jgi:hypothetical protein
VDAVQHSQSGRHEHHQQNPTSGGQSELDHRTVTEHRLQQRWDDGHQTEHHDDEDDGTQGESESEETLLDRVAAVLLVIGDVHRGDQVVDPPGGAEQGQDDGEDGTPAEGGTVLAVDLIDDQLPNFRRQHGKSVHLVGDHGRVSEQPVQGDQGDHGREQREEGKEGDAGPEQRHLVDLGLGPAPFDDLQPALGGDLGRRLRVFAGTADVTLCIGSGRLTGRHRVHLTCGLSARVFTDSHHVSSSDAAR